MNHKIMKSVILSFAFISMAACKGSSDPSQEVKNTVNAKGNPVVDSASYASACSSSTLPNLGPLKFPGTQTVYAISALDFSKKQIYFSDGDCKDQTFTVEETGTVNINGPSTKVSGAVDEDFNFKKTTVTILNQTIVDGFNLAGICGAKDWAINTAKDVSSQAAKVTCPGEPSPRTAYEVSNVENNTLLLGANATKTQVEERPTQLDRAKVYNKQ